MHDELNANETIADVVTVSGWYPTSQGRYAEVLWYGGRTRINRVAERVPSRAEEVARIERALAEQDAR